jgi:hypothetical protein
MNPTLPLLLLFLTACGDPDKPDDTAPPSPDDTATEPTDADSDGYPSDIDCDDENPDVHPDADEVCNEVDDDCDGGVDEDATDASTWYTDADADGWGDPDSPVAACEQPSDAVTDNTDCDDGDSGSNPDAEEICDDGADNDCDGAADEYCAPPDDYPLEGADAVLYGTTEGATAGWAIDSAGDVNGDGWDDLLIGAPDAVWEGDELEGSYRGRTNGAAMIVLGPVTGDLDLDAADAWLQGTSIEDGHICVDAGWSVAGVGDTNGDGFDDVLIGDPDYFWDTGSSTMNYTGMAGLFLGPVEGVQDLWSADATLATGSYGAGTGYDVAGAGDVNGDGLADILISAPWGDLVDTDGGEVYVVAGNLEGDLIGAGFLATLYTDSHHDFVGYAVSSAGDVDGDGLDDILVGAGYDSSIAESAGVAYLVLSPVSGELPLADSHLRLRGQTAYGHVGQVLSDVGDLDGDGYDDFGLGQMAASITQYYAGAAYIYYGSSHLLSGDATLDDAEATLTGTMESEKAAGSIAGAGDTDGDGRSELLVGSFSYGSSSEAGTTWLVPGPIHGTWALDDIAATRFEGPNAGDQAGVTVSSAGDVDADGLPDILIGAPGDDTNSVEAGAVYLVLAAGL